MVAGVPAGQGTHGLKQHLVPLRPDLCPNEQLPGEPEASAVHLHGSPAATGAARVCGRAARCLNSPVQCGAPLRRAGRAVGALHTAELGGSH